MYLRYILLASISALGKLFSLLLGWLVIAPFIWVRMDGNYPSALRSVCQPIDSPAIGDQMYADNQMVWTAKLPRWLAYYLRAYFWSCCRNPLYGFDNLAGFTIPEGAQIKVTGNPSIDIGTQATFGTVTRECNGYFDCKHAGAWNTNYGYMVRFGWVMNETACAGYRALLTIDVRPLIKLP